MLTLHYELLNFAMNFRSSKHFSEKLVEIDCNIAPEKLSLLHGPLEETV